MKLFTHVFSLVFLLTFSYGQEEYLNQNITILPNIYNAGSYMTGDILYSSKGDFYFIDTKLNELWASTRNDTIQKISFNIPKALVNLDFFNKLKEKYGKPSSMTKPEILDDGSTKYRDLFEFKTTTHKIIDCDSFKEEPMFISWDFETYNFTLSLVAESYANFSFKSSN